MYTRGYDDCEGLSIVYGCTIEYFFLNEIFQNFENAIYLNSLNLFVYIRICFGLWKEWIQIHEKIVHDNICNFQMIESNNFKNSMNC